MRLFVKVGKFLRLHSVRVSGIHLRQKSITARLTVMLNILTVTQRLISRYTFLRFCTESYPYLRR